SEFQNKTYKNTLEGNIYKNIYNELISKKIQENIAREFPKKEIHRRNTGYAVDELMDNHVFGDSPDDFNLCKLLSGSEGTLAFTTEITLQLDDIPPKY